MADMDLSYALDHPVVSGEAAQRVHLLVRVETWPEEGGAERKPLDIALALDRSGSMEGVKLAKTKEAAIALLQQLGPRDRFSLVTFESEVDVVVPPTAPTDLEVLRRRIEAIEPGASTNLSGGWLRALSLLAEPREGDPLRRVLLLTDGQANRGVTDRAGLEEIARQHREAGIVTTTLGFGGDFREDDLVAIATAGGGRFHYVDSPDKAAAAFLAEFGELTRIFGQNCELGITPGDGIPAPEILGGAPATPGRNLTIPLGDVRDRDRRQVLAAFSLPDRMAEGAHVLATVRLEYDAVRGKVGRRRHVLTVPLRVSPEESRGAAPLPEVAREVALEQAGRWKRQALEALDRGDGSGAMTRLETAAQWLTEQRGLDPEFFDREAANLRALAGEAARPDSALRKKLAAQSFDLQEQSGAYAAAPRTDRRVYALSPQTPHVLDDAADHMKETLKRFGWDETAIGQLEFALRELGENAIEHGCRGMPCGEIALELQLGRNHAEVSVRDPGQGFDFPATLAREEQAGDAPPKGGRGRGLITVSRGVDTLAANARGNEVRAALRRQTAHFTRRSETLLSIAGVGEAPVLAIRGYLDSHSHRAAEAKLDEVFRQGLFRVIVDLTHCEYVSSAGIGVFIEGLRRAQEGGGKLVLVCPGSHVRDTFELMGLSGFFPFAASVAEARTLLEST